jgi:hypothetical protein
MDEGDDFHAIAEACLALHETVKQAGTPTMQALSQALLFEVGRELALREIRGGANGDGD